MQNREFKTNYAEYALHTLRMCSIVYRNAKIYQKYVQVRTTGTYWEEYAPVHTGTYRYVPQ